AAGLLPGLAAVVGTLNHLAKPTARLGGVQPVRVGGRTFHMVDFPAAEEGTVHRPLLPLTIGGQDKRALARADQYPYSAHPFLLRECEQLRAGELPAPL